MSHRLLRSGASLAAASALLAIAASCTNTIESGGSGAGADAATDDLGAIAKQTFEDEIAPLLEGFCAACHSAPGDVGFLEPDPDVHTTVMSWPALVDVKNPGNSRLVTKGQHDGPAWTTDQLVTLRDWLDLEAAAAGNEVEPELETRVFEPQVGVNTVDLSIIGLSGSTVSFRMETLAVGAYFSEIMVNGGTGGAHLVHPLFVPWVEGAPLPDPVDRFSDIDLSVDEAASVMIGGGTLVLVDVPTKFEMSINFEVAEPAIGGPGDLGGGCKNVAAFSANAAQPLANSCGNCHGGNNTAATGATDMRLINDLSPEGQAGACAQILSRVNLADPVNSGIFVAPDPASGTGHQFKFPNQAQFVAFRDALLAWIAQENQ